MGAAVLALKDVMFLCTSADHNNYMPVILSFSCSFGYILYGAFFLTGLNLNWFTKFQKRYKPGVHD